jgi:hypothetical protein
VQAAPTHVQSSSIRFGAGAATPWPRWEKATVAGRLRMFRFKSISAVPTRPLQWPPAPRTPAPSERTASLSVGEGEVFRQHFPPLSFTDCLRPCSLAHPLAHAPHHVLHSNGFGQIGSNSAINSMIMNPTVVFGSNTFVSISAGATHTCGATSAAVKCWGGNTYGQLGSGSTTLCDSNPPLWQSSNGNVRCCRSAIPVQALATTASSVTAGAYFSCAVASSGVSCWGQNNYGQVGRRLRNVQRL